MTIVQPTTTQAVKRSNSRKSKAAQAAAAAAVAAAAQSMQEQIMVNLKSIPDELYRSNTYFIILTFLCVL